LAGQQAAAGWVRRLGGTTGWGGEAVADADGVGGPRMALAGMGALVTGGGSGLGAATARALALRGARVAVVDRDGDAAAKVADQLGALTGRDGTGLALTADVTDQAQVAAAVDGAAAAAFGGLRVAVLCAGVGWAQRLLGRDGPASLEAFETVVRVNLTGTFNVLRLAAAAMARNHPDRDGQRGVVVMTASIAAFDGQIGQTAYAASKGGIVSLTLPAARDLAREGVRVCTIAPGVFDTPLLGGLPEAARQALAAGVPFPQRLGQPDEFALLACQIAEHPYLNGEVIRLDAALRMPPK
jgi:NAD(P)-dependent dehydrogenase (short-subunit alcohol dehydrogenase family)